VPSLEHGPVVFESEMTALRLVRQGSEGSLDLSVNYCSRIYKTRYQGRGRRRRAAILAKAAFERITDAGYIAQLSLRDSPANIRRVTEAFRSQGRQEHLWSVDDSERELFFHPDLLTDVAGDNSDLTVRYFEAEIVPREDTHDADLDIVGNIPFGRGAELLVGRRLSAELVGVDADSVQAFAGEDKENTEDECVSQENELERKRANEQRMMKPFERVGRGLTQIISSRKFWLETTASAKMRKRLRVDAGAVADG
jgi:hypothetical protein